jgi:hypothetical protein
MMTISNHFSALLDPAGVIAACAQSGALDSLPVSAKRSADRMSPTVVDELAEHDAAIDELYRQLIAKATKTSPIRSKELVRHEEGTEATTEPIGGGGAHGGSDHAARSRLPRRRQAG